MYNSPIPFVKSEITPGYYLSFQYVNNSSQKIYLQNYNQLLFALEQISNYRNKNININEIKVLGVDYSYALNFTDIEILPLVFLECFEGGNYYTCNLALEADEPVKETPQPYIAGLAWSTNDCN